MDLPAKRVFEILIDRWQPKPCGIESGEEAVNVTGDYSDERRMAPEAGLEPATR